MIDRGAIEERIAIKMESMRISEVEAARQAIDEATQSRQGSDMHIADLMQWLRDGNNGPRTW